MVSFSVYSILNVDRSVSEKLCSPDNSNRVLSSSSPSLLGDDERERDALKEPVSSVFVMLALNTEPEVSISSVVDPVGTAIPPVHPGKVAPVIAKIQNPVPVSLSDVVSRWPARKDATSVSLKFFEIPAWIFIVFDSRPVSGLYLLYDADSVPCRRGVNCRTRDDEKT